MYLIYSDCNSNNNCIIVAYICILKPIKSLNNHGVVYQIYVGKYVYKQLRMNIQIVKQQQDQGTYRRWCLIKNIRGVTDHTQRQHLKDKQPQ